jgi:hypothetical protein
MPTSTDVAQITYPQSDGQSMADNTKQFRWIVTIEGGSTRCFVLTHRSLWQVTCCGTRSRAPGNLHGPRCDGRLWTPER